MLSQHKSQIFGLAVVLAWIVATFWWASSCLPLPNLGFAQDIGTMLDGGWRFYQGLRPHADYHTALGPVFGLIFGVPMILGGPDYSSLRYLPPAVSALVALWAWGICWRSLPQVGSVAVALAMGSVAGGIYHIGFPPEALSFAVFYNRVGFGIFGIVTLAALLPRCSSEIAINRLRDATVLVALSLLLFLKVSFFVFAAPLALAAFVLHRRGRGDYLLVALVGVACLFYFLNAIGFRLDLMLWDLWTASLARKSSAANYWFPARNALANYDFAGLLLLQSIVCYLVLSGAPGFKARMAGQLAVLWGPAALGWLMTLIQSHGDGRGISTALAGIAASAAWLRVFVARQPEKANETKTAARKTASSNPGLCALSTAIVILAAALFVGPHAVAYLQWRSVSVQPGPAQFEAPPLRDLYIGPFVNVLEPGSVSKINEAVSLLLRHCSPTDSMQYMDDNNPYGFACGLRTPRGSNMFWETGSSYSRDFHPPASGFDDTDFLLAPKPGLKQNPPQTLWREIYGDYIREHFEMAEETDFFELYRRRK